MPVADGKLVKAVQSFTLPDNCLAQNAFYWQTAFATPQAKGDVIDAIEVFIEDFYGDMAAQVVSSVVAGALDVAVLGWDGAAAKWLTEEVLGTASPSITFTGTGDSLPNAVAPTITAKTDRPRSNGRKAILPFAESQCADNTLTSGALSQLAVVAADWMLLIIMDASNSLLPVIYRRGVNEILELNSASVPSIVGSMRTRKPGVGA